MSKHKPDILTPEEIAFLQSGHVDEKFGHIVFDRLDDGRIGQKIAKRLHRSVLDELYRIGKEALGNAIGNGLGQDLSTEYLIDLLDLTGPSISRMRKRGAIELEHLLVLLYAVGGWDDPLPLPQKGKVEAQLFIIAEQKMRDFLRQAGKPCTLPHREITYLEYYMVREVHTVYDRFAALRPHRPQPTPTSAELDQLIDEIRDRIRESLNLPTDSHGGFGAWPLEHRQAYELLNERYQTWRELFTWVYEFLGERSLRVEPLLPCEDVEPMLPREDEEKL